MCTGQKVKGHISRLTRFLQDPTLQSARRRATA